MSSLPDSVLEVITSEAACACKVKGCKLNHNYKLVKCELDAVLRGVPLPPGLEGQGYSGRWAREKVVRDLRQDLMALAPRNWGSDSVARLHDAVAAHNWYA